MNNVSLNDEYLYFEGESTTIVNSNFPINSFNLAVFTSTNMTVFIVNLLVLFWLKIKENNLVDRMVLLDCLANIAVVIVHSLAFPVRIWHYTYVCYVISYFRCFVLTMNR